MLASDPKESVMKYRMLKKGGTTGAVSKKILNWRAGQVLEAPENEFKHLPPGHFEILKGKRAERATIEPEAERATLEPEPAATAGARKYADDYGVDLRDVSGSGQGGKITKGDVEEHVQAEE